MQLSFNFRPKPGANFRLPKGTRVLHPVTGKYLAVGGWWAKPVSFSVFGMIFTMCLKYTTWKGEEVMTDFYFFAAVPA